MTDGEGAAMAVRARVVQVQGLSAHADYAEMIEPRRPWSDGGAYDKQARHLAELLRENFRQFEGEVSSAIACSGPLAANGDGS